MDGIVFLAIYRVLFTLVGLAATAFGVDSRRTSTARRASPDGRARPTVGSFEA